MTQNLNLANFIQRRSDGKIYLDTDKNIYLDVDTDNTIKIYSNDIKIIEIHDEGVAHNITTVNAATYDTVSGDDIILVTYSATAAVTSLTITTDQLIAGRILTIKDAGMNAGTNHITIDTEGTAKIDNEDTYVINGDGDAVKLVSDSTNWWII